MRHVAIHRRHVAADTPRLGGLAYLHGGGTASGGLASDGLARAGRLEAALLEQYEDILASYGTRSLAVRFELSLDGACPNTHHAAVLRVTNELLSNAVDHGFYGRQRGNLRVDVACRANAAVHVAVSDDGWGFDPGRVVEGNGLHLLRQIGELRFEASAAPFVTRVAVTLGIPPRAQWAS